MGCENGAIYIMENFEIIRQPYAKGDHSVNHLLAIPVSSSSVPSGLGPANSSNSNNSSGGSVHHHRRRSSSSGGALHHHHHHAASSSSLSASSSSRVYDALIVAGDFNRVLLYHAGKCLASAPTEDWVCSLAAVGQPAKERTFGLAVGCLDQSVSYMEVSFSLTWFGLAPDSKRNCTKGGEGGDLQAAT